MHTHQINRMDEQKQNQETASIINPDTHLTMDAKSGGALKVVKSALIVMPPRDKWGAIQQLRRRHDKSYFRWMPHVNVLYPFVPDHDVNFARAAAAAREALARVHPFTVRMQKFSNFVHNKHSCTLWLDPGQVRVMLLLFA
jgi:hypothetical protein